MFLYFKKKIHILTVERIPKDKAAIGYESFILIYILVEVEVESKESATHCREIEKIKSSYECHH